MDVSSSLATVSDVATLLAGLDLRIEHLPVDGLTAYGRKARTHTRAMIQKLAAVIDEFGFVVPIVVDQRGRVLAGNARIEAARLLKLASVPVVRVRHLTEAQKRAFVLADNRMGELSGWDRDTLKIELEELSGLDLDFSLELTGFNEAEIDALTVGGASVDTRADRAPPPPQQPVSQIGDVWELGPHRLICDDALQPDTLRRLIGEEKVRMVFTDPPYNVAVEGHVTSNRSHGEFVMASGEMTDAAFTEFLVQVWRQIAEAMLDGGLAYVCMDWRHMRHTLNGLAATELELLNLIVWNKTVGGMGSFYRSQHELIFLAKRPGAGHLNRVQLGTNGRDRTNVWACEGVGGFGKGKAKLRDLHPTVKPVALVADAILDASARDDRVLDLFSGSGSTLLACERTGRVGRAVELDPKYVDVGVVRWQDYTGRQARLAETGETFAQVQARRGRARSAPLLVEG